MALVKRNHREVAEAFARGEHGRSPSAPVPGGCRVASEYDAGNTTFFSYATAIARWQGVDKVVVAEKKYSVSTAAHKRHLVRALEAEGFRPTDETVPFQWKVPGRWGGFGPAWHETGWETVPAVVWVKA